MKTKNCLLYYVSTMEIMENYNFYKMYRHPNIMEKIGYYNFCKIYIITI